MRKLVLYIACSLDGYIAQKNNDLSFLNKVQIENEDYGYGKFINEVDTILIGKTTYDWVVNEVGEFPHKNFPIYVITHQETPNFDNISFYNGSLSKLVTQLKQQPGGTIFCDGGANIVHQLLQEKSFDELIVSIIPVLLGDGVRLFNNGFEVQELKLLDVNHYKTGLVQLKYSVL